MKVVNGVEQKRNFSVAVEVQQKSLCGATLCMELKSESWRTAA